ncbi:hypothetical protein [Geomonas propionica]|uniref:Lipocalin-like domain-containing protein n=1 Tax=Geomonas propionica TaxID=2798582 RepID=A0ABS0YZ29_9BACT|nr:hypothetical protein [Geomonas propionica]MBJ6802762.1 hypothetical protein [Geomonas propionica]
MTINVRQKHFKSGHFEDSAYPNLGEVGIYWFITPSEILQDSVPRTEGDDDGDFVNGPSGHYEFWEHLKTQIPNLKGTEYDRVPRGRVIYSKKDSTFLVYGSTETISNPQRRLIIERDFRLRGERVKYIQDSHYETDHLISIIPEEFDR